MSMKGHVACSVNYLIETGGLLEVTDNHGESCEPFFFKFCPSHIFEIDEARHFKFRVLIDTEEYECKHDILLPKGMCSESRNLFKFWAISDNIS